MYFAFIVSFVLPDTSDLCVDLQPLVMTLKYYLNKGLPVELVSALLCV
jgi:hypothetical protein